MNLNLYTVFLIDASGVLYEEMAAVPGAPQVVEKIQALKKHLYVVTNNTNLNVAQISQKLHKLGMSIPESNIISSGQGLKEDPIAQVLIYDKTVYVLGTTDSQDYIRAAGGTPVLQLEEAQAAVITSADSQTDLEPLIQWARQHPTLPIMCSNPDLYVQTKRLKFPVAGFFAREVERAIQRPLYWIGKPYDNFSDVVKNHLQRTLGLSPSPSWVFIDDNLENVAAMSRHLGITGCHITGTGLGSNYAHLMQIPSLSPDSLIQPNIW